jgi:hypothetical protein
VDMNNLIRMVEGGAGKLAERWMERVKREEGMADYLRIPEEELLEHIRHAYEAIGTHLDQPKHPLMAEHFRALGRRREKEGIRLMEIVRAIQLARSVLWQHVVEQGVFDSTVNLYQALNLHRQVVVFFDHAVLFAIEGYLEKE